MLQKLQAKVTSEGKKEQELYDKFMCYCKNSGTTLNEQIQEASTKLAALSSSIEESSSRKTQTVANEREHRASRAEANDDVAKATALREKEAAAFAAEEAE